MSAADLLVAARGNLVIHGWTQHTYRADDGSLCMIGALSLAANGDANALIRCAGSAHLAAHKLLTSATGRGSVTVFNDDDGTTSELVLSVYDAAIVAAKEAGL